MRSDKLRKSARGQQCTLRIPGVCNGNPETTILAHMQFDGGIMGGKAPDYSAAFACSSCHEAIDQHRVEDRYRIMGRGMVRTWEAWINSGLVVVSGLQGKAERIARKRVA